MKHVFLTGDIGIGKTTALTKFLERSGKAYDGVVTRFDVRAGEDTSITRTLTMYKADSPQPRSDWSSTVAAVVTASGREVYIDAFDNFGAEALRSSGKYDLIVMDELGIMEEASVPFKRAVFDKLDGPKRVFGVIKKAQSPFLTAIISRSDVELLEVTKFNRDEIPNTLQKAILQAGSALLT